MWRPNRLPKFNTCLRRPLTEIGLVRCTNSCLLSNISLLEFSPPSCQHKVSYSSSCNCFAAYLYPVSIGWDALELADFDQRRSLWSNGRYGLMVQTGPMAELSTVHIQRPGGRNEKRVPAIGLFAGLRCCSFLAVLYLFFWIDHWT